MASPTVVQVVPASSTKGDSLTNNSEMFFNMPVPAKVGNSLLLCFTRSGSVAGNISNTSCTDDQANTYTGVQGGIDTSHDQVAGAFHKINIAVPVKQVKLKNISGGSFTDVQAILVELNDVTAIDVVNNGVDETGSTGVTGGSLAVTQTGDLIVLFGARTSSVSTSSFAPTSHANITWRKCGSNINDGTFLQAGVYNSTSALTPQCDMGTSTSWASVALAFKAGSSGSPRSAQAIAGIHHTGFLTPTPNPIKIELPAIGNLIVIIRSGGVPPGSGEISSISDNKGNTWVVRPSIENDASIQCAYALNPTVGDDLLLTITPTDNVGDHTYMIYDFVGADGYSFDNEVSLTGTQAADADLTTVTITPRAAGIILGAVSWAHGTGVGVTDTDMTFNAIWWGGQPVDGPTNLDENNGWASLLNADTIARTFTWQKTVASGAAAGWESLAVAFNVAPPAVRPMRQVSSPLRW